MDSSGLRVLVEAQQRAEAGGRESRAADAESPDHPTARSRGPHGEFPDRRPGLNNTRPRHPRWLRCRQVSRQLAEGMSDGLWSDSGQPSNRAAPGLDLRAPADTAELSEIRRRVRAYVTDAGGGDDIADDLELVVSELATNVIEHTTSPTLTVRCREDARRLGPRRGRCRRPQHPRSRRAARSERGHRPRSVRRGVARGRRATSSTTADAMPCGAAVTCRRVP